MLRLALLFALAPTSLLFSQHHHEDHPNKPDTLPHPGMVSAYSLNLPMSRNGSGTSWQPDATPMYAYMKMWGRWNLMVHGSFFFRYNHQDIRNLTGRADSLTDRFDAPNWAMLMLNRRAGKRGLFAFNLMVSADPLLLGGDGYPILLQTGETWQGRPLIDRQHPHDLISDLSIGYTHMLNPDMDLTLYLGMPGEPAIGPPVFMHRISAFNNPNAPLGHHWVDATHITFGVATLGFRYKIMKLEFCNFTGREPDENRYNFDRPRFDSYSFRVSVNPNANLSFQLSQAFIKSPESSDPAHDINRSTASVLHSIAPSEKTQLSSALTWGMNHVSGERPQHSFLLESNLQINKIALYGRHELIQKGAAELQIIQPEMDEIFLINMLTLGSNYTLFSKLKTDIRLGAQGSVYFLDRGLNAIYGAMPLAVQVYLRINPAKLPAGGM